MVLILIPVMIRGNIVHFSVLLSFVDDLRTGKRSGMEGRQGGRGGGGNNTKN